MDMQERLSSIIAPMEIEAVTTLQKWIHINSVKEEAAPGAPFGKAVAGMLDVALADCKAMGFSPRNHDGYAGDIEIGEGDEVVGIITHLDIVPAGDGWEQDPFGGEIIDGVIYGRGTSDDKGPAVASLYAMKAIKSLGIPLKKRVRLIFGCDEESGMEDMEYYKKIGEMPAMGFSPDAEYPVINTEKGRAQLRIDGSMPTGGLKIYSIHSGDRPNVIPGSAVAVVAGDEDMVSTLASFAEEEGYTLSAKAMDDGKVRIEATGIPGHAAFPENTQNACGVLLKTLKALGAIGLVAWLADRIGTDPYGVSLGVALTDHVSGPLTCNLGILRCDEGTLAATLDIRFPVMTNTEMMIKIIGDSVKREGGQLLVEECKGSHHVPEDTDLVQGLLAAYHQVTGRPKATLAMGGGTYARYLGQGVAFGCAFPGDGDKAHQAGECMTVDNLMLNIRILATAILNLAG